MTTKIGRLKYDPNNIVGKGSYGTIVFSGFLRESREGFFERVLQPKIYEPVAIKRVAKSEVSLGEVGIMKNTFDSPYILRLIHTEDNNDFL